MSTVGRPVQAWRVVLEEIEKTRSWRAAGGGMKPTTDVSDFAGCSPYVLRTLEKLAKWALWEGEGGE